LKLQSLVCKKHDRKYMLRQRGGGPQHWQLLDVGGKSSEQIPAVERLAALVVLTALVLLVEKSHHTAAHQETCVSTLERALRLVHPPIKVLSGDDVRLLAQKVLLAERPNNDSLLAPRKRRRFIPLYVPVVSVVLAQPGEGSSQPIDVDLKGHLVGHTVAERSRSNYNKWNILG